MLPISDDNRGRRTQPIVTWALIGINLLIYAYQWTLSPRALNSFMAEWAVIPERITSGAGYHTLITSAFLHGSWFHVLSNMLFLWIFGDNVEDVMGHVKFIIFYLLTAVAAAFAQILIDPHSAIPMVGASGAISGVLAAYIILFPHGRIRTLLTLGIFITMAMLPAWIMIGYWFVLQILSGVLSLGAGDNGGGGVAFFAHIGGFVAGLALAWIFRDRGRQDHQNANRLDSSAAQTWGVQPGRRS